ncbi:MAG: TonB-dependent receptor [Colwellia sp.]|nr:TonB-dependent receptor [Colwellia sp.]
MKINHTRKLNLIAAAIIASSSMVISQCAFADITSATIKGVILTQGVTAGAGTEIKLVNVDTGFSKSVLSNESGRYRISGLKPGRYKLYVDGVVKGDIITVNVGDSKAMNIVNDVKDPSKADEETADIEVITVTGAVSVLDITSEVGTHVSLEQINRMPQISRNFLAFADMAPGVNVSGDGTDNISISGGAQTSSSINVFIDGVSQKDYVLTGGVSGQDSSRGNPFPQAAIGQYKILTSNYKAELDEVASVGIIAATKSGGNEFHGGITLDYTDSDMRASTPTEQESGTKAKSSQKQVSLWASGPIIENKLHFLATYERKSNEDQRVIDITGRAEDMLVNHYLPESLEQEIYNELGSVIAPFEQDLFFVKLDWLIDEDQDLSVSVKYRDESEITGIGGNKSYGYGTNKTNDDLRVTLKHNYYSDSFENEFTFAYEDTQWSPAAIQDGMLGNIYEMANGNLIDGSIFSIGGGPDFQNKGQKGWTIKNDLTFADFTLAGEHTVKVGFKYKQIELNAVEQNPKNPQVHYAFDITGIDTSYLASDRINPLPYKIAYGQPLTTSSGETLRPNAVSENKQLSIYIQDDWQVTDRLELNLGVRWSYEETPIYLDYKTPQDVLTAIKGGVDGDGNVVEPWSSINYFTDGREDYVLGLNPEIVAPVEGDYGTPDEYAEALGVYDQDVMDRSSHIASIAGAVYDINDYISDGSQRKASTNNFAPRIGFSYALNDERTHVIYGGFGRSYDRTIFDGIQLETTKGSFPRRTISLDTGHNLPCVEPCISITDQSQLDDIYKSILAGNGVTLPSGEVVTGSREVFMINNKLKTPYVDQYSLGLRSQMEIYGLAFESEIGVKEVKSRDGFMWKLGNRSPDGSFNETGTTWGAPWSGDIQGNEHSHLLLGDNGLESDLTSWHIKLDKRYTPEQPWGLAITYTNTDATENRQYAETFSLDYPTIDGFGVNPSAGVDEHVLITSFSYDFPWGILFSGKLKLKSGAPVYAVSNEFGPENAFHDVIYHRDEDKSGLWAFKQFDMSLSKNFDIASGSAFIRVDVLNLFNTKNWAVGNRDHGFYNANLGVFEPNEKVGIHESGLMGPMRTAKISVGYNF